jgi:hypothetical protein
MGNMMMMTMMMKLHLDMGSLTKADLQRLAKKIAAHATAAATVSLATAWHARHGPNSAPAAATASLTT